MFFPVKKDVVPATTVFGEVRGYRAWGFRGAPWDREGAPRLTPLVQRHAAIPVTTEPQEAVCLLAGALNPVDGSLIHKEPIVPAVDCSCGFYAIYQGGLAPLTGRVASRVGLVLGSVLLSGRVIFGDQGVMRGQVMRMEGFLAARPRDVYKAVYAEYRFDRDLEAFFAESLAYASSWAGAEFKLPVLGLEDFKAAFPMPSAPVVAGSTLPVAGDFTWTT